MKKIIFLFVITLSVKISAAQSIYVSPSIGIYLNSDVIRPLDLIGYEMEIGYCFANEISAGVSYGTLDLANKSPFVQARTGYTLIERKTFSLSIGVGVGYTFRINQIIGEGDLVANIHMPKNTDVTLSFSNQVVYKAGYFPAINIGFTRCFTFRSKNKK